MLGSSAQFNQAYSPDEFLVLPSIYKGNWDLGHRLSLSTMTLEVGGGTESVMPSSAIGGAVKAKPHP